MSREKGFRNPFWENPGAASGPATTTRPVSIINRDITEFEARVGAAKKYVQSQAGRRYRNGDCVDLAVSERTRPALAFEGNAARYYGAARCAPVIAAKPFTCASIRKAAGLESDAAFNDRQCGGSLAAAQTVVAGQTPSRDLLTKHEAIVATAQRAVSQNPGGRAVIARQCIGDVAVDSRNALDQWRTQRDLGASKEQSGLAECRKAVDVLTDEEDQRAALSRELEAAQRASGKTTKASDKPASRQARDYACTPR